MSNTTKKCVNTICKRIVTKAHNKTKKDRSAFVKEIKQREKILKKSKTPGDLEKLNQLKLSMLGPRV